MTIYKDEIEGKSSDELREHAAKKVRIAERIREDLKWADHGAYSQDLNRVHDYINDATILRNLADQRDQK